MKIYISADMEGLSGVVSDRQVTTGNREYERARMRMVKEINVVIDSLFNNGVSEVLVNDSHATMENILIDQLDDRASLISGSPKPLSMMQGINSNYDGVFFIGYHSRPGLQEGVLDHVYSSSTVFEARINRIPMSEAGINGRLAGYYEVPVVLISGDQQTINCARKELNDPVGVVVKKAIGRTCAQIFSFDVVENRIRKGVSEAVNRISELEPNMETGKLELEVDFKDCAMAEMGSLIPGVERKEGRTLIYKTEDYLELFKTFRAMITMGSSVS